MTHQSRKSKNLTYMPERHARPGSDYGLVRRVARLLGKSESLVSGVKRGSIPVHGPETRRISEALEREREAMGLEEEGRTNVAGN